MQANHRSWADFFLDVVMTHGRAQMLSRYFLSHRFIFRSENLIDICSMSGFM